MLISSSNQKLSSLTRQKYNLHIKKIFTNYIYLFQTCKKFQNTHIYIILSNQEHNISCEELVCSKSLSSLEDTKLIISYYHAVGGEILQRRLFIRPFVHVALVTIHHQSSFQNLFKISIDFKKIVFKVTEKLGPYIHFIFCYRIVFSCETGCVTQSVTITVLF